MENYEALTRELVEKRYLTHSRRGGYVMAGKTFNTYNYKSACAAMPLDVIERHGLELPFYKEPQQLVGCILQCAPKIFKEIRSKDMAKSGTDVVDTDGFKYILDLTSDKEHLFNINERCVSAFNVSAFKKLMLPEERGEFFARPIPSIFSFDPFNIAPYRKIVQENVQLTQFNLYQPPGWMEADENGEHLIEAKEVKLPPLFHEFMEHVFPKLEARNFVWGWMYFALTSRAETYLVLNGKKGLGKGVLAEEFIKSLVGEDNFKIAPESFLTSDFNSSLDKGRVVYLDEVKIDTDSKVNKLKRYINSRQAIERKGIDADKVVQTYNSFIVSNNRLIDMVVEWDDRRFSVMDMNETTLRDVWGQEKVDELIAMIRTPEFQKLFGYYVLYYGKQEGQDEFSVYRGEHFYRLVYTSLAEWQKLIVDTILSRKEAEYDLRDLRSEYKNRVDMGKFPVKIDRISGFLDNYRHNGEECLGRAENREEGIVIIPSEKFLPVSDTVSNVHDLI